MKMQEIQKLFIRSLLVFGLSGCGYQLNSPLPVNEAPTISIPYVQGDVDGQLTAALIREISSSGMYTYRSHGGQWILNARLIDESYENIGYRYDRSRKGKLKNWIIPVELREGVLIEVELMAADTCHIVQGPNRLQAEIDYDHDYYTIRDGVNVFSLGQLTDIDSAEDAAKTPLYQRLAEKVASWLIYN